MQNSTSMQAQTHTYTDVDKVTRTRYKVGFPRTCTLSYDSEIRTNSFSSSSSPNMLNPDSALLCDASRDEIQ